MEIISDEFYVYANDINYINTHFVSKNKEHINVELPLPNLIRSKLLNVHQNATNNFQDNSDNLKRKKSEVDNSEDNPSKCKKSEKFDESDDIEINNADNIRDHPQKNGRILLKHLEEKHQERQQKYEEEAYKLKE
ncbi:22526_t:CDS:2 [Dentiscutata erythropus]|uniref:22526_t:CDS:1 n=1 Tax=Dentiscutata erythropus TaxID=1348616 RepID=A0A9N9AK14_9GLOM|nr:22526_t:CDS:2 [Dentiscutata erythropus]